MTKAELRRMAHREAAGWLWKAADCSDLSEDILSESEEDWVREFIRNEIVNALRKKGERPNQERR